MNEYKYQKKDEADDFFKKLDYQYQKSKRDEEEKLIK